MCFSMLQLAFVHRIHNKTLNVNLMKMQRDTVGRLWWLWKPPYANKVHSITFKVAMKMKFLYHWQQSQWVFYESNCFIWTTWWHLIYLQSLQPWGEPQILYSLKLPFQLLGIAHYALHHGVWIVLITTIAHVLHKFFIKVNFCASAYTMHHLGLLKYQS